LGFLEGEAEVGDIGGKVPEMGFGFK